MRSLIDHFLNNETVLNRKRINMTERQQKTREKYRIFTSDKDK